MRCSTLSPRHVLPLSLQGSETPQVQLDLHNLSQVMRHPPFSMEVVEVTRILHLVLGKQLL